MVNTDKPLTNLYVRWVTALIVVYIVLVVATLVALAILSTTTPAEATPEAWGHAVVVGLFAVVLPLRLRAVRRGSRRAHTAIGVIAAVLAVVNVVEGALPGVFPLWMRIEMFIIAGLMAAIAGLIVRHRR